MHVVSWIKKDFICKSLCLTLKSILCYRWCAEWHLCHNKRRRVHKGTSQDSRQKRGSDNGGVQQQGGGARGGCGQGLDWLIDWLLLNVPLKNCQWWASKWRLCLAIRAIEQRGIFIVSHLLWQGALVFWSYLRNCHIQLPCMINKRVERNFSTSDNYVVWMEFKLRKFELEKMVLNRIWNKSMLSINLLSKWIYANGI